MITEVPIARDGGAGFLADEIGEALGEFSLRRGRKGLEQHRRDDQAENAVAEEFEPLVGEPAGSGADMRHRLFKQRAVGEAMAEPRLEPRKSFARWHYLIFWKKRPQRASCGHFHTCHGGVPSSIEKKIISARPTRFS